MSAEIESFKAFGEAAVIGLLVGIERYRSRGEGERKSAGVRTFAVVGLLGATCALIAESGVTLITITALTFFLSLGYWRESEKSLGLTTELAALLTFLLGYLTMGHEALAVSSAIVLVALLAHKQTLHGFIRSGLTELEFYDTLKFLLVVFVVYPVLPAGGFGPQEIFRPRQLWLLVILVSTISYSGYVLIRVFGGRRGLLLNGLVGGVVSTTAVTVSLAERARARPDLARLLGVTAVLANSVQAPRLLLLVLVVNPALAGLLAIPLLGMFGAGALGALALARLSGAFDEEPGEVLLQNPYSFWPAAKFALLFAAVFAASNAAREWMGEGAIYGVSAAAGLVDASAISLTVAEMAGQGAISPTAAGVAVLIAVGGDALLKLTLAAQMGGARFAFWLGGGLMTMIGVCVGLFAVQRVW